MDANGIVVPGDETVVGRNVNTARGASTVYDISALLDSGETFKFGTFNGDMAGVAAGLKGQRTSFRYELKITNKNGTEYKNYNLLAIAPEGQLPPDDSTQTSTSPSGIPIVNAGSSQGGGAKKGGWGGGGSSKDPEVQRMIVKQNVFGTSLDFYGRLYQGLGPDAAEEAFAKAEEKAAHLYGVITKRYNEQNPPAAAPVAVQPVQPVVVTPVAAPPVPEATAQIVPVATTAAEVAASVPGVQVGAPVAAVAPASSTEVAWD